MHIIFWLENLKGRNHCEDLDVDGSIILECISGKWCEVVDWMNLDQDSDQWRVLLNRVMNLWVPYKAGNYLTN
jgi:hypothetical protein